MEADVVDEDRQDQPPEIAPGGAAQAPALGDEHRGEGEEDPQNVGEENHANDLEAGRDPEHKADGHEDPCREFHDRGQSLEDEEEGHAEKSGHAVAGIEDHAPVPPEGLQGSSLPAVPLRGVLGDLLGDLGVADGVRDEDELLILLVAAVVDVPVKPHGELDVVGDGIGPRAADLLKEVLPDEDQRSGDAEHAPQPGKPDSRPLEAPGVFDLLIETDEAPRESLRDDLPVDDGESVGGTDNPRHGGDPRVAKKGARHVEEGVRLKKAVGIDDAEEGIARHGDSGVDGVGPATVDLVDHDEVRVVGGLVDGADLLGADVAPSEAVDPAEFEAFSEDLHGSVGGAVADDDDLELGVGQPKDVADGGADDRGLVEAGDDQGDRHAESGLTDSAELGEGDGPVVAPDLKRSYQQE